MNKPDSPKTIALDALDDLIRTAQHRAERNRRLDHDAQAKAHDDIAATLRGAVTRLNEDGDEYLDAALAFIDAGRTTLGGLVEAAPILDLIEQTGRRA